MDWFSACAIAGIGFVGGMLSWAIATTGRRAINSLPPTIVGVDASLIVDGLWFVSLTTASGEKLHGIGDSYEMALNDAAQPHQPMEVSRA